MTTTARTAIDLPNLFPNCSCDGEIRSRMGGASIKVSFIAKYVRSHDLALYAQTPGWTHSVRAADTSIDAAIYIVHCSAAE